MEAAVPILILDIFIHVLDEFLQKRVVAILGSAEETVAENLFTRVYTGSNGANRAAVPVLPVLGRRTAAVSADDEVEDGDEPRTFQTELASSAEQSVE